MGDTIQDDLREAFAEADKETTTATETPDPSPPRDEHGRFAARTEPTEVETAAELQPDGQKAPTAAPAPSTPPPTAAPTDPQTPPDGQWNQDKAPQSWTPTAREKWMTIPEDLRKEIVRREEASVAGVRQMQEQYAPVEHVMRGIDPYVREAVQSGVDPVSYLGAVLQSERLLRRADVPTKFQELLRIADQYGVPLREIIDQSVGQQVLTKPQQQAQAQLPPEVMQELQANRQWRQQQEEQRVNSDVSTFSQGKEFFNDVRVLMADMVDSGMANGLQDAYDKACWASPQVREVLLARERTGGQQTDLQQRQARAAGASLAPNGKIDVKLPEGTPGDDLADTVREAFNAQTTGRV